MLDLPLLIKWNNKRPLLFTTQIMLDIALSAIEPLSGSHWILDGFPRTIGQGRMLDQALIKQGNGLNMVVNLAVSDEAILKRIEGSLSFLFPFGRRY